MNLTIRAGWTYVGGATAPGTGMFVGTGEPGEMVPDLVLIALASAWEDRARDARNSDPQRGNPTPDADHVTTAVRMEATVFESCARMLREAIAHAGQG
jgi:hypothetical protein